MANSNVIYHLGKLKEAGDVLQTLQSSSKDDPQSLAEFARQKDAMMDAFNALRNLKPEDVLN